MPKYFGDLRKDPNLETYPHGLGLRGFRVHAGSVGIGGSAGFWDWGFTACREALAFGCRA